MGSGAKFTPRMASAGRLALTGASWSISPRGCPDPRELGGGQRGLLRGRGGSQASGAGGLLITGDGASQSDI